MADQGKKVPKLFIILATLLFLIASFLLVVMFFYRQGKDEKFQQYLDKGDMLASQENHSRAELKYNQAAYFAQNASQWKQLLLRSYQSSLEFNDWNFLEDMSRKALRDFPGREDFRAYYAISLLWVGKVDKAVDEAEKLYSNEYQNIRAEIYLVEESLRVNPQGIDYQGVLELLESSRNPFYFQEIGLMTGNKPLLANAALLWMEQGETKKAYDLIPHIIHKDIPDQLPGYIAYDWGDLELSQSFLTNQLLVDKGHYRERWTLNALLGDIAWMLDQEELAKSYYLKSLEIENHWRPLLNLSLLEAQQGLGKPSLNWMEESLEEFSLESAVVRHFVLFWREDYPLMAERLLQRYMEENPEDLSLLLTQVLYFPRQWTPQEYEAFLWDLFNHNSSHQEITRFMLWYSMAKGDLSGSQLILERHRREQPVNQWSVLYDGILSVISRQEEIPQVVETLKSIPESRRNWYFWYNLAVLQVRNMNPQGALESLKEAENGLAKEVQPENLELQGRIASLYAMVYLNMGDKVQARNYAQRSLSLEPNNHYARRVILEIEE